MSFSFRDRDGKLGDRLRGKSGEEILQSLREQLDQDKKMFFDTGPSFSGSQSTKSPFARTGFPFDNEDEGGRLPRGSRFQKHLDDLASRHPEFAEHLLHPEMGFRTWGCRPRRGSGGSGGVFSSEDDTSDSRSQASGGSVASGEQAQASTSTAAAEPEEPRGRSKLPQYGLRNTVDLGGAAQKLEQSERGQRSWSAPPDGRAQEEGQPKRFVSRIEIHPRNPDDPNQPQPVSPPASSAAPGKPPMAPKQTTKPSGNVRHIPIFVEGRDEPVIARDTSDNPQQNPGEPYCGNNFSDRFSRPQFSNSFHPHQFGPQPFQSQHTPPQPFHPQHQSQQHTFHPQQQPQKVPTQPQKRPTAGTNQPSNKRPTDAPSAPSPPPAPQPKHNNDPLVKVAAVQKDVDGLLEQVSQFTGERTDKRYIYLDEMLTRNLIQLDDIETQGKDDVRQARKDTIRSIQRAISILESKAPLNKDEAKTEEVESSMEVEGESKVEKQTETTPEATGEIQTAVVDTPQNVEVKLLSDEIPADTQSKSVEESPNTASDKSRSETATLSEAAAPTTGECPEVPTTENSDPPTLATTQETVSSFVTEQAMAPEGQAEAK